MKVIDLLNKIANGEEYEEALFYVNGDFFYDLIVIEKNLFVINTTTKKIEPLESEYIGRFIRDNVELLRLDKNEIIEEDKKIEKLNIELNSNDENKVNYYRATNIECDMAFKINELIDEVNKLKDDNK